MKWNEYSSNNEAIRDDLGLKLSGYNTIIVCSTLMLGSAFEFVSQVSIPT